MKCAMVILNYRDSHRAVKLAKKCEQFNIVDKIAIVDNCSKDDSLNVLEKVKSEKIEIVASDENNGFAAGNNLGARYLVDKYNPEFIFFANTDTDFPETNLYRCIEALENNPKIGLVSTRMNGPDGKEQRAFYNDKTYLDFIEDCFVFFRKKKFNQFLPNTDFDEKIKIVDIIRGSFMFFKTDVLKKIDYFDESTFLYCEESIIRERLKKKGYQVGLITDVFYLHNHIETKSNNIIASTKRFNASRYYFACTYWNISFPKKMFLKLCMKYNVLEVQIIEVIKRKKK